MRRLLFGLLLMPFVALAQSLDSLHIIVDAGALNVGVPYVYKTFQDAAVHFVDGITVYVKPGVYWIDDPDDPTLRVGENGREPFGMVVRCPHLKLVGLGEKPEDVVLASRRGQTQGAVGNFTMFDFWTTSLQVENLTMGNYCNVDLVYPKNPRLNRPKRSAVITQAHVGYVHGDSLTAKKVRFISRLNLNPLNGAKYSYYEDCHFECTDDALNGTAIYRRCDFDLYGQKPFWCTFGKGAMFIDCDFNVKSDNHEVYFCKQGGPVTVINSRFHAPADTYIGWTAYPQPWLRCYQCNFTLNGQPYTIGNRQPQNTVIDNGPNLAARNDVPYLALSQHQIELRTGDAPAVLKCKDDFMVRWRIPKEYTPYLSLSTNSGEEVVLTPKNNTDETVDFCLLASSIDGREAACHVIVHPRLLPPPVFLKNPVMEIKKGEARLNYKLDLRNRRDESLVTWLRDDIPVGVASAYQLSEADNGHQLTAVIRPRLHGSKTGASVRVSKAIQGQKRSNILDTDFHGFPCQWQRNVLPGYWTVDGFKPSDTADYPWSFETDKPMWEYKEGFNGAVGMGLLQAQRGARIMYTPLERTYGNMSLVLDVDPTKTAGQGFGSATGQYMDVCLKFDTRTLTGYGLRIIRTTKHAKAVDFLLVRYDHGTITPLTEAVSSTCYRTGCSISLHFMDGRLTAHVETTTPQPADSSLPHQVDLSVNVPATPDGGIHIQHTGSCGESTTMLHRLQVKWN